MIVEVDLRGGGPQDGVQSLNHPVPDRLEFPTWPIRKYKREKAVRCVSVYLRVDGTNIFNFEGYGEATTSKGHNEAD